MEKATANKEALPPDVFFQTLYIPSVKESSMIRTVNLIEVEDWRAPIMSYLRGHYEPETKEENKRIQQRLRSYHLQGHQLYKIGIVAPLSKCISQKEESVGDIPSGTHKEGER